MIWVQSELGCVYWCTPILHVSDFLATKSARSSAVSVDQMRVAWG